MSNDKDNERIARLEELLTMAMQDELKKFKANKESADWFNNNTPYVGQTIDYQSYPPMAKWVEHAIELLNNPSQPVPDNQDQEYEAEIERLKGLLLREREHVISGWGMNGEQYDKEMNLFKKENNL